MCVGEELGVLESVRGELCGSTRGQGYGVRVGNAEREKERERVNSSVQKFKCITPS